MKKILSIILMLTLALVLFSCSNSECYTCVDKSGDGKCDVCGSSMNDCKHVDKDFNDKCDACGKDMPVGPCEECVDEDLDGLCDVCGEIVDYYEPCEECEDEDEDGICDICGEEIEEEPEAECKVHVDVNKDSKCDKCGETIKSDDKPTDDTCKHTDTNKDGKCDKCKETVPVDPCKKHVDANKDGKCDVCKENMPVEACNDHVDANEDGKCDKCSATIESGPGSGSGSSITDPIQMIIDMYKALAPTKVETETTKSWGKYILVDTSVLRVGKIDGDDVSVYEFTETTLDSIESGAGVAINPPYSTVSHIWEYHSTLGRREDGGKWNKTGDDFTPSVGANALNITAKTVSDVQIDEEERTVSFIVLKKNTKSVFGTEIGSNVSVVISYSDADITEVNISYSVMDDDDLPEISVNVNIKYDYAIQQITID